MMGITCVQFPFFSLTPDSSASVPFDLCVCLMHRLILKKKNANEGVTKLTVNKLLHVYFRVYDANSQYIALK